MPIATNRMSYTDCYEMFEKAMADPKGIRLFFPNRKEARHYQMRLHNSRAVDRRENKLLHPDPGHKLHGQSAYDVYSIRMREGEDGSWFVYIEPKNKFINEDIVESLSDVEGDETEDETHEAQS